jgi:hypothetical protein
MRILTACAAVAGASLLAVPASAQSVDDIVAKHLAARGGYEKIKAIQSLKITRTVATPFTSIKVVVFKKRPALVRFEQTPLGQTAAVARGINAETVWDTGAGGKVTTRAAQFASEAREIDADFDGLLVDWKEKGHTVALEGKEAMTGWEGYKLKVTTKGGVVRHIYIDTATYLDRRHAGTVTLPPPANAAAGAPPRQYNFVSDFSDWKEVNGVKFPFAVDEDRVGPRDPAQSFATYTEKIEANVPMEDTIFAPPSGSVGPWVRRSVGP